MIKETGFDSIRIRIGFDSSLDEVAQMLDICQELGIEVLYRERAREFALYHQPLRLRLGGDGARLRRGDSKAAD